MKLMQWMRNGALAVAMTGALAPQIGLAAAPAAEAPVAAVQATVVSDVSLQDGGMLVGQIIDAQGKPQANTDVRVLHDGQAVASIKTNDNGQFAVRGLRGGVHEVQTAQTSETYRLWAPRTAPPAANQGVLLINDGQVLRGQVLDGPYAPAIRGAIAGGLLATGVGYALDYNPTGS